MTTNITFITDALKLLGVIAETQTASPEQGDVGLRRMNQMLEQWDEDGIKLGWFEQSSTVAEAPLPKWAEKGVTSKLAQDLQPLYPASSLAPWVMDDRLNGYGTIIRKLITESLHGADMSHLPSGSGRRNNNSILTDS